MKRLLLLLISILPLLCFAGKIGLDRTENGIRIVDTEYEYLETDNGIAFSVYLSATQNLSTTDTLSNKYYLGLYLATQQRSIGFPENARLLLRNSANEVITLTAVNGPSVDQVGHVVRFGKDVWTSYSISPLFELTDDILDFISKGIIKVRFELDNCHVQYYEHSFKKDKVWKKLSRQFEDLKKVLSTNQPQKASKFSEDF